MIKNLSLLLLATITLFPSCKDGVDLNNFKLEYDSYVTFTENNTQIVDAVVISDSTTYDLAEDMVFHGSDINRLNDCFIHECALEIENPKSADFTFLKDAILYIMSDSLPLVQFAQIDDVPEAVKRFVIPVNSEASVLPQFKSGKYRIRIRFNTRRTLSENVKVKLRTQFKVHTN